MSFKNFAPWMIGERAIDKSNDALVVISKRSDDITATVVHAVGRWKGDSYLSYVSMLHFLDYPKKMECDKVSEIVINGKRYKLIPIED